MFSRLVALCERNGMERHRVERPLASLRALYQVAGARGLVGDSPLPDSRVMDFLRSATDMRGTLFQAAGHDEGWVNVESTDRGISIRHDGEELVLAFADVWVVGAVLSLMELLDNGDTVGEIWCGEWQPDLVATALAPWTAEWLVIDGDDWFVQLSDVILSAALLPGQVLDCLPAGSLLAESKYELIGGSGSPGTDDSGYALVARIGPRYFAYQSDPGEWLELQAQDDRGAVTEFREDYTASEPVDGLAEEFVEHLPAGDE